MPIIANAVNFFEKMTNFFRIPNLTFFDFYIKGRAIKWKFIF